VLAPFSLLPPHAALTEAAAIATAQNRQRPSHVDFTTVRIRPNAPRAEQVAPSLPRTTLSVVFVVAILELATPPEQEAAALAADLGTTAYEERLRLVAGTPTVVLTTPEKPRAQRLLTDLRRRAHGAIACDAAAVVPSARMVSMRTFAFEQGVLIAGPPGERLDAEDIVALIRAVHRTTSQTREEVKARKFSAGRALLTGGLVATKTVKSEQRTTSHEATQVLYVFRASGATPWILHERGTNYAGLGGELSASAAQNFATTVSALRRFAPHAAYDERLVTRKPARTPAAATDIAAMDLSAHLLAAWFARARSVGP
jgi:hypothetical protein